MPRRRAHAERWCGSPVDGIRTCASPLLQSGRQGWSVRGRTRQRGNTVSASWLRKSLLDRRTPGRSSSAPSATGRAESAADEKLWYLSRIDIFADMTESDMRRLAERTVMRRYARGAVIVRQDDPADAIYLIKEGRVKLCRYSPTGRVQILALLERGDIWGERGLDGGDTGTHSEAFDDTLVCLLRWHDLEDLIRSKPELAFRVMRNLALRLRRAEEAIEDLAFRDVPGRLATLLSRLADSYGEPHPDGRRLVLRFTHQDLASMIGATRETVTNVLTRFRDDGLIAIDERHIVVRDLDRLRALTM
jgi:CRP/FNR family cyclic AMP-dependent transcriptional regulator